MKRINTRVEVIARTDGRHAQNALGRAMRASLAACYTRLAQARRGPGIEVRRQVLALSRTALSTAPETTRWLLIELLEHPLDSVRYFELQFCFDRTRSMHRLERVLDVSSPRVLPLLLLAGRADTVAHVLNPDASDLALTQALSAAWEVDDRCIWHECPVAAVALPAESMDLVTSISVVEHVSDDSEALRTMWRLVRPGGRLVITVPVATEAFEEYMDDEVYVTSPVDSDGWTFASRCYDESLLQRRLVGAVGEPSHTAIYGERQAGCFFEMRRRKWVDPKYPYWREPYVMATAFRAFPSISDLPGLGIIGIEWTKPAPTGD